LSPKKFVVRSAGVTLATSMFALLGMPAAAYDGSGASYYAYDGGLTLEGSGGPTDPGAGGSFYGPQSTSVPLSFNAISQVDVRSLHANRSEIPPDTNGAVGTTQFLETTNGAYAVYDKATGARQQLIGDGAFWAAAGQPASNGPFGFSNGDSRVLFDAPSQRWVVESFGAALSNIQIAVSTTSDALGPWESTSFTGFAGGIADYPTLAIDSKAIYIGTNDFGGANPSLQGTTLNVIARNDLLGAGPPVATSLKQFFTAYPGVDRGFGIQGVNQVGNSDNGRVIAAGANTYGLVDYSVTNPGSSSATETAPLAVDPTHYGSNAPGAQPDGSKVIDTLDDRVSSAAWEYNGKLYAIHTITPLNGTHTILEMYVIDAATNAVIQKTTIGDGVHDFYQGSLTVNNSGQVVIGYNESGADLNVSIFAAVYNPTSGGNGALTAVGSPILLKTSPINNYHNGSTAGSPPAGRQRWGDYAQVTVDPNNPLSFWVIGEYALGYLPDPTYNLSRWGTFVSEVNIAAVPEPASWAMMLVGFGLIGGAMRRRKAVAVL